MFLKLRWMLTIIILILFISSYRITSYVDLYIWEERFIYKASDLINDYDVNDSLFTNPWDIQFGATKKISDKPTFLLCNCVYEKWLNANRPKKYTKKQYLDYLNLQGLLCEVNARELKKYFENKYIYKKNLRELRMPIHDSLWEQHERYRPSPELFKNMKQLTDSLNKRLIMLDEYSNDKKLGVMVNWIM